MEAFCVVRCNSDVFSNSVPEVVWSEGNRQLLPFTGVRVEVETNNFLKLLLMSGTFD
jgi:uncharacterized membrane protein